MKKSKGIKIHKTKYKGPKRKNSKLRNVLSIMLTVVLAGAMFFIGYSVGAPIINYFKNYKANAGASSYGEYIPPEIVSPDSSVSDNSQSGLNDSYDKSGASSDNSNQNKESNKGFALQISALDSLSSLQSALGQLSNADYSFVSVPLKAEGGMLYYASSLEDAEVAGAVSPDALTLNDIADAITAAGFLPAAQISVLADNIYPNTYGDTAFRFEDGDTLWLDNKLDNGGKPWISPFSAGAKSYMSRITDEITSSGFQIVFCEDIEFPQFRESDLGYIGSIVQSDTRYLALTETAQQIINAAASNDAKVIIEESASAIINGTSEIYKPLELDGEIYSCSLNPSDADSIQGLALDENITDYDKAVLMIDALKQTFNDDVFYVSINQNDFADADLTRIYDYLTDNDLNLRLVG